MLIFGWIALILLAMFGLFCLGLFVGPFIIAKVKSFGLKIKYYLDDEKIDSQKRSEERRHRDEIKRQRDFELANRKLDVKLNKVNKQIKIQTEKLKLAEKLKQQTQLEKEDLQEQDPFKDQEEPGISLDLD